ncbi:MAG TPA: ATP-binding protein [Kofleriaceae bacterium]|nr:ATP-binding protein [Kofleriaceae bacterium]
MITHFRLEDFKGHRDTKLAFEQFTMLVGDNGSGKTSVLEALYLQMAASRDLEVFRSHNLAPEDLCRRGSKGVFRLSSTSVIRQQQWDLELAIHRPDTSWMASISGHGPDGRFSADAYLGNEYNESSLNPGGDWETVHSATSVVELYGFEPAKIAASAYSDHPDTPVREDGAQTAVALAALKLGDDEAFDRIEAAMRELVPSLERIRIKPAEVVRPARNDTVIGSKLFFDFRGSPGIPAHHASHGTLIVLALLTVLHGREHRPDLILLDDFDHALHPRAQMEVVRMIKGLLALDELKETQIIATTHSPYVLDELAPKNVIAFALRDDGTVASKSLSEHPDAPKVNGALKSGELWSLDAERDWVL